MAVILERPEILNQGPPTELNFVATGNHLVSENCKLDIRINFTNGQQLNCAVRVRIDSKLQKYLTLEPNNPDSNGYDIYRYYGKVDNGKTDTFKFRLKTDLTVAQLKAFASPVIMIISVYDRDYRDIKISQNVKWNIT